MARMKDAGGQSRKCKMQKAKLRTRYNPQGGGLAPAKKRGARYHVAFMRHLTTRNESISRTTESCYLTCDESRSISRRLGRLSHSANRQTIFVGVLVFHFALRTFTSSFTLYSILSPLFASFMIYPFSARLRSAALTAVLPLPDHSHRYFIPPV